MHAADANDGWPALQVVNVARNKLTSLAPLASAAQLTTLKADTNLLEHASAIPLIGWKRLKTLTLSANSLNEMPAGVGQLMHLEVFDFVSLFTGCHGPEFWISVGE